MRARRRAHRRCWQRSCCHAVRSALQRPARGLSRIAPRPASAAADAAAADQPAAGVRRGFLAARRRLAARSERCETRYRRRADQRHRPPELAKGRLLLMAQPLAQTAENLVALDDWVRGGGRVLLLADPLLEWPSKRPLGDPLRPPPMFADTGLLAHWGLRLDAPDERGPAVRKLGGFDDHDRFARRALRSLRDQRGPASSRDCRIGKGEAIVVADADLLDIDRPRAGASPQSRRACSRSLRSSSDSDSLSHRLIHRARHARTGEERAADCARRKAAEIRHWP